MRFFNLLNLFVEDWFSFSDNSFSFFEQWTLFVEKRNWNSIVNEIIFVNYESTHISNEFSVEVSFEISVFSDMYRDAWQLKHLQPPSPFPSKIAKKFHCIWSFLEIISILSKKLYFDYITVFFFNEKLIEKRPPVPDKNQYSASD